MYLWVFPNEIRRYIDQTFTSVPSGIFQNLGGHFPKSTLALWQVRIKNCIFFCSVLTGCSTNALSNPLGIRPEVLALACEDMRQGVIAGRVDLTRAAVYRILRRHAATGTLVPSPRGLPGRLHLVKTMLCWGCSDRVASAQALTSWMRNLYGMRAGWKTINNRLFSHGYRAYRPTRMSLLITNHPLLRSELAQRWQNLVIALTACHLRWQVQIPTLPGRWQAYRVCHLPGERVQQRL